MTVDTAYTGELPGLTLLARGKVRDIYDVDDNSLLFVASDRLSAFDVVMKTGIPDKGKVLTQISMFWFDLLKDVPNHVITADVNEMPAQIQKYASQLAGRSMLVKKLKMLPVEAIVRGYITGSGWKEYQRKGTVCDLELPKGLENCSKLEKPLFTPSTKAEDGLHDENIHPDKSAQILGAELNQKVAETAIQIYETARAFAAERGIIIADTKFEFGLDNDGNLVLADEVLTPDSSRFWPADEYTPGKEQNSFDKQFIRNYLESINYDKTTPVTIPDNVITRSQQKYLEAFEIITGKKLST
ncbi:phosphoribosylaminoimidazole-succinocarboxamide synthase [Sphaeroforma arctica JP610]|uniref:Phosphoribosylaminoimidazole-succinocarboxamide synthase n=1 Tax=Sphaeroforma arctica JP610 TaxID=667725 RepID=A0A0L0G3K9_9EUKA|nr:phosphoribosylaminoimidazole-succinocarboxamide synthase [Sphaeroforma arctica JP610]KNC83692.1 phosphoribosylaminoimidazole-succinocarboxamide synthase [Sphaeroforma arctica JP610]|eukprot:XP_014157594.1 phosphoribosylaminoimidazole-succinocarboxamide synthase [Sphaeroforma arctica JP610]